MTMVIGSATGHVPGHGRKTTEKSKDSTGYVSRSGYARRSRGRRTR